MFDDHFVLCVGYLPPRLPTSCLTMAPRFDTLARSEALSRRPLLEINRAGMTHVLFLKIFFFGYCLFDYLGVFYVT